MYYLTVKKGDTDIVHRQQFDDYGAAVAFTSRFYQSTSARSVLVFTTEAIGGQFARSFAALTRTESLRPDEPFYMERYRTAANQENAFKYDASYLFLIESEIGIHDAQAMQAAYESDE